MSYEFLLSAIFTIDILALLCDTLHGIELFRGPSPQSLGLEPLLLDALQGQHPLKSWFHSPVRSLSAFTIPCPVPAPEPSLTVNPSIPCNRKCQTRQTTETTRSGPNSWFHALPRAYSCFGGFHVPSGRTMQCGVPRVFLAPLRPIIDDNPRRPC